MRLQETAARCLFRLRLSPRFQQDEAPPVAPKMPLGLQGSLGMLDWASIDE